MRVLITGGAGFIGTYFSERFLEEGEAVTSLDLVASDVTGVRTVIGDVRDPVAVREALDGADRVLHLAAAHHDFGISEATYFDVNERGTRVVCEGMAEASITRCCFYSTVAVYGDNPPPRTEETPPKPVNAYGASKLAGEEVLRLWSQAGEGCQALVIRPSVVFGPRNFANMFSLIRQIARRRFLQIGEGSNLKSLAYIDNLVSGTLHLWRNPQSQPFEVYNYVDKPDLTSRQIAAEVHKALGRKAPSFSVPLGLGLFLAKPFDLVIGLTGINLRVSSARILKLAAMETRFEADRLEATSFEADVPLGDGLARMVEWYQKEGRHQKPAHRIPPADPRKAPRTSQAGVSSES